MMEFKGHWFNPLCGWLPEMDDHTYTHFIILTNSLIS